MFRKRNFAARLVSVVLACILMLSFCTAAYADSVERVGGWVELEDGTYVTEEEYAEMQAAEAAAKAEAERIAQEAAAKAEAERIAAEKAAAEKAAAEKAAAEAAARAEAERIAKEAAAKAEAERIAAEKAAAEAAAKAKADADAAAQAEAERLAKEAAEKAEAERIAAAKAAEEAEAKAKTETETKGETQTKNDTVDPYEWIRQQLSEENREGLERRLEVYARANWAGENNEATLRVNAIIEQHPVWSDWTRESVYVDATGRERTACSGFAYMLADAACGYSNEEPMAKYQYKLTTANPDYVRQYTMVHLKSANHAVFVLSVDPETNTFVAISGNNGGTVLISTYSLDNVRQVVDLDYNSPERKAERRAILK